jgi:predicted NUDIX family NTP pyrophosphohydrolase
VNFEPQKLFIGLIDFFSIILPGALLTFFVRDRVGPWLLGSEDAYRELGREQGVSAFLFCSYLLGHFVFLIGSWLLDEVYGRVRDATTARQIERLADGGTLVPRPLRWLAARWFTADTDHAVAEVLRIKHHHLEPLGAAAAVNAYQWAKARLTLEAPAALEAVQRFEADSKFFRSLFIVLLLLMAMFALVPPHRVEVALACVPLLVLALWRFVDQRRKSIDQAYWYVITQEAARKEGYRQPWADGEVRTPLRAGAAVFQRLPGGEPEFLLVQATAGAGEWALPESRVAPGEPPARAAVREVLSRAGVWAAVRGPLDDVVADRGAGGANVRHFLMEAVGSERPSDRERKWHWMSMSVASRARLDEVAIRVLAQAQARIASIRHRG